MRTDYVYLIGTGDGPIKIGHAGKIKSRLTGLQMGNWQELSLLHSVTVPCVSAPAIEKLLHEQFQERWVRGEWFDVPLEVLKDALDTAARDYVLERGKSSGFSQGVCLNLCKDPQRAFFAVSRYRDMAAKPGSGPRIAAINRLLMDSAGQAAYVMFQSVIVEGRDITHVVRNDAMLARQAEASLIKALDVLTVIWERVRAQEISAMGRRFDIPRKSAA